MTRARVSFLFGLLVLAFGLPLPQAARADDAAGGANAQAIAQLNQEIAQYEAKIKEADANKATLQNALNTLELQKKKVAAQIAATQNRIASAQTQITKLGTQISDIQDIVDADKAALAEDLRSMQQSDTRPFVAQLLSSDSIASVWVDADALTQVNSAIKEKLYALAAQENALSDSQAASEAQKTTLTAQKRTLAGQKTSLTQTSAKKTQLLKETNASEAQYQKLLAAAKAELASFSTFAQNAGGSGLLANQTSCDSWGCYYNQRDTQWGNDPLNGTRYRLKSDGCLVTSMAMIMTHYGYRDVTPVTINTNPANFAAYYPAYLLFTINVDGMTVTRKSAYINATLNTGNPVVVGIYAYGGTHFVVLTKRTAGGDYLMRDPYVPNAKDIPFSSHYALKNVFGVSKVVISS
jgi:peptidoglycan hydrolase CwlO-like protein